MVNIDKNLTVDDLIVEYMMYKVNKGYEPQFSTLEFRDFLEYFKSKMPVYDTLDINEELFQRFMKRKSESDWSHIIDWKTNKKQVNPHMDLIYSEKDKDYILKANYRLSDYDKSIINTYFMDNRMSKFEHFKGTAAKIRDIIGEYLIGQPKRKFDETVAVEEASLVVGKYVACEILRNIWSSYINKQIEEHKWPEQCQDIEKYLLERDLAEIIGLKSIKKELLKFYKVMAKRIAILYQQDKNLKISSNYGSYLARSNYELLMDGYKEIFEIAFGRYKSSLNIDLALATFQESHEVDGFYMWDEEPDIRTTTFPIENDNVKKLVRSLDKNI